jgi:hypothetical protein
LDTTALELPVTCPFCPSHGFFLFVFGAFKLKRGN